MGRTIVDQTRLLRLDVRIFDVKCADALADLFRVVFWQLPRLEVLHFDTGRCGLGDAHVQRFTEPPEHVSAGTSAMPCRAVRRLTLSVRSGGE
jgi:hypothetical protein